MENAPGTTEPVAEKGSSHLPLIIAIVVLVVAAGVGGFLYFTRDTAPDELKLADSPSDSTTGAAVDANDLDGTWTVVDGTEPGVSAAGYRVQEVFLAGARRATAVGRTNDVTGSLTVADNKVTEATVTVDMTTLQSDQARRDDAIRTRGLQTNEFKTATFELTEPIDLPEITSGKTFEVKATGNLILHGTTKQVTVDLTARSRGDIFSINGEVPIVMADYGIEPPSVSGMLDVDDHGSLEFIVNFEKI